MRDSVTVRPSSDAATQSNADAGSDLLYGMIAGVAGGAAGTLAMDAVSHLWSMARRAPKGEHAEMEREQSLSQQGGRPDVDAAKKQGKHSGERGSVATTKVAEEIGERVLRRPLTPKERKEGGRMVHYLFGMAAGAAYGIGAEKVEAVRAGFGILFGLLVWAGAIPATLPALRLTRPPHHYSAGEHAFGITAHAVYGLTAEFTRRGVRALLAR